VTQQLTRRQLREAERRGEATPLQSVNPGHTAPASPSPARPKPVATPTQQARTEQQLTRRQMREQGLLGSPARIDERPAVLEKSSTQPDSRRARRAAAVEPGEIDAPQVDFPEPTFTGQNLLAEPSTESIILDSMPEAISLPIETGEVAITGSIEVISGPMTGPTTAALEGMDGLDTEEGESVTGVISTVEPISALQLIDERSGFAAVPAKVLRKGWWKPWAVGAGSAGLIVAAIIAVMTILSVVGG
jgi:hypothetical protein